MALQSSGEISLGDLQGEFGGSNPIAISEYYRGGLLVPDTVANADIPLTGLIAFSDFYEASSTPALNAHILNYSPSGGEDACNGGTPVTVYQTSEFPNLSDPIYTSAAGTTFRATGYYSLFDEFRFWSSISGVWTGEGASICLEFVPS